MTKRQIIDGIMEINHTADAEFLADFNDVELREYLEHLHRLDMPRLSGNPQRFDKYFRESPAAQPAPSTTTAAVAEQPDDCGVGRFAAALADLGDLESDESETSNYTPEFEDEYHSRLRKAIHRLDAMESNGENWLF